MITAKHRGVVLGDSKNPRRLTAVPESLSPPPGLGTDAEVIPPSSSRQKVGTKAEWSAIQSLIPQGLRLERIAPTIRKDASSTRPRDSFPRLARIQREGRAGQLRGFTLGEIVISVPAPLFSRRVAALAQEPRNDIHGFAKADMRGRCGRREIQGLA